MRLGHFAHHIHVRIAGVALIDGVIEEERLPIPRHNRKDGLTRGACARSKEHGNLVVIDEPLGIGVSRRRIGRVIGDDQL